MSRVLQSIYVLNITHKQQISGVVQNFRQNIFKLFPLMTRFFVLIP